jgi:two-component system osmolarity sensor histidine kinase EnvZ
LRRHVWPNGLMGQVMAVLLAAIVLEFLGSALLYRYFDTSALRKDRAQHVAEQLVVADRLLASTAPSLRPLVANQLSSDHITVNWRDTAVADQTAVNDDLQDLRKIMTTWEDRLISRDIRLAADPADDAIVEGSLMLDDRSFIHFRTEVPGTWQTVYASAASIGLLILGVMVAAALVIRALGSPLRHLTGAADAAGHGAPVLLTESGPPDLRALARAFNAMQLRIADLIESRTRALAAVSHDLRTPLSRLRLQAEQIDEELVRAAIGKDIHEMERMLDSVLTYLSGQANEEEARLTDLASLAMTVVDDASDTGRPVEYDGPDSLHAKVGALRVKRALDNLIDNAVHYGDRAWVSLSRSEAGIHLVVEDAGPGIPPEQLADVIEPFRRLDYARPRNTDGLGLGLSIVAHTMQQERGELRLCNAAPRGLRAEMFFPQGSIDSRNNLK